MPVTAVKSLKIFECSRCKKCFKRLHALLAHEMSHVNSKMFRGERSWCDNCGKYRNSSSFRRHQEQCLMRAYVCSECCEPFSTASRLRGHLLKAHRENFSCQECAKSFDDYMKLYKHEKCHEKQMFCVICNIKCPTKLLLQRHMDGHLGIENQTLQSPKIRKKVKCFEKKRVKNFDQSKNFPCDLCSKGYSTKMKLDTHMSLKHGSLQKPYLCTICGRRYTYKDCLDRHMKSHIYLEDHDTSQFNVPNEQSSIICADNLLDTTESANMSSDSFAIAGRFMRKVFFQANPARPFMCSVCGLCCGSRTLLRHHDLVHTGERPNKCTLCDKAYQQPGALVDHMNIVHLKKFDHVCTICGRKFVRSTYLKYHMRSHTGEKPHGCNVCGKSYRSPALLRGHKQTHLETKSHSCNICGASFKLKQTLNNHVRIHDEERMYTCTVCDKGFNQLHNMKTHMRIHSGERPYVCSICFMSFPHQGSWKKHFEGHN